MKNRPAIWLLGISILLVGGCAFDVYNMPKSYSVMYKTPTSSNNFTLSHGVDISPPGGFVRTLKIGTTWRQVGTLPQGGVYHSHDQVFTIEASHVYEAYLVVSGQKLVGFYLPVERAFTPLDPIIQLPIKHNN